MAVDLEAEGRERTEVAVTLVDCDVHPMVPIERIVEHIPEPHRSRYFNSEVYWDDPTAVDTPTAIYIPPLQVLRQDSVPPGGGMPGSDHAFLEEQLFQGVGVDYAILQALSPRPKLGQAELENALWTGLNAAVAETWLDEYNAHGRYRNAIRVCPYDAPGAVAEIERWAGHPYVCEVYIVPEAAQPLGHPQIFPVLEAAARHDLPICLHVSRTPGMRLLTPAGFPSYHLEIFPQWPLYFMSHIASLVFEGVFDRLPNLKIVGVEGGFTWATPFAWRLDRYWEALGRELTGARRQPSEYFRDHLRLTTQPLEEPTPPQALLEMIEWLGGEDLLMFATDYPHYDYDDPAWIIPRLPKDSRSKILARNAIDLYGLPHARPVDEIDVAAGRAGGRAEP